MILIYFPNNVAAIMVALCWKKLCTSIPGEGGASLEEHNIYVVTGYNQLNFVP